MLHTPLIDMHRRLGARLVDFAGWEMPILFSSIRDEHLRTRSAASLFDVSHMGRVWFEGADADALLERLCTRRVRDMAVGQCRYSLVCNERGGVRDDVLIYRLDDDRFMLVVNASNREKLLGHFEQVAAGLDARWRDRTLETCMVAVQGPRAMELIADACPEAADLKRYRFMQRALAGADAIVSRTGYTGEDGVEAIFPAEGAERALSALLDDINLAAPGAPVKPAGLGARDTLRLEAGMPLYGHELGEEIQAFSSGVDFAINLDKDEREDGVACVGLEALKEQAAKGVERKIAGILLDGPRTARQGMAVLVEGERAGEVASACVAPSVGCPIATAFVATQLAGALDAPVEIDAGSRQLAGRFTALPFYKK